MFFWDPTMIIILPALVLAFYAQYKVRSTFARYNEIRSSRGITGREAAEYILRRNGILDVTVEEIDGMLNDHSEPRTTKVRLSSNNYRRDSLSAVAVAAHEVGHAIQHATGYVPLQLRHSILPVTNLGSTLAFPLFLIGLFLNTPFLMDLGILFFGGVVVFHLVTLPVEFNASSRALVQLEENGLLTAGEVSGARKVLTAAALTYVATTLMAALELVRLILLRNMRD